MRAALVLGLVAGALLLGGVQSGLADPNLPTVAPHRHFIVTAAGELVAVGPSVCGNPSVQTAFNQFHSNVHFAVANSPGPEHSAPGVHNGVGADLTARGCAFAP